MKKCAKLFLCVFVALLGFSIAVHGVNSGVHLPILEIRVSPGSLEIERGCRQRFSVTFSGMGNIPRGLSWLLEGAEHGDTHILDDGTLILSPLETAERLVLRIVSVFDPSIYRTVNVTVIEPTREGSLARQLVRLRNFAMDGGTYVVEIGEDEDIVSAMAALPSGRNDLSVILRGVGETRSVGLSGDGSLFSVGPGLTLVLDGNLILRGGEGNGASLVFVEPGGTLVMNAGTTITGNTGAGARGAGVNVQGVFTMNGGEISGNAATREGGGVFVGPSGTFVMRDGRIADNLAAREGGGVFVAGTFVMYGGAISNNVAASHIWARGGGVIVGCLDNGLFAMRGGLISRNMAVSDTATWAGGGGVHIGGYRPGGGTFLMSDGIISDDNVSRFVGNMADVGTPLNADGTAVARRGTFDGDGGFTPLGELLPAGHTIEMRDGLLQGVLTVKVTGIPTRYDNWSRSISLWDGFCGWAGSITECDAGSSATFTLVARPGAYRIHLYIWYDDNWIEYAVRSKRLAAGTNIIPFSLFRN